MIAKEEAKKLFDRFLEYMPFKDKKLFYESINETKKCVDYMETQTAKQCAIICVDWHIKEFIDVYGDDLIENIAYWEEVKQEIEKL